MKITAKTDTYVSTPWGAGITVLAGEIKTVGDDIGYECIQAGCTEVRDEPKPKPKPKLKKKKSVKKKETDIIIEV